MPYNGIGDLYKAEIVEKLQEMGCNVQSVRALNLILEEMGLQEHYGNHWLPTDEGVKFTVFSGPVYDPEGWHPSLVGAVYEYLQLRNK